MTCELKVFSHDIQSGPTDDQYSHNGIKPRILA
jgi:hypothetical protein